MPHVTNIAIKGSETSRRQNTKKLFSHLTAVVFLQKMEDGENGDAGVTATRNIIRNTDTEHVTIPNLQDGATTAKAATRMNMIAIIMVMAVVRESIPSHMHQT